MTARCTLATGIAVLCATSLGLAQSTTSQPKERGSDQKQTVTIVGCLQEEKDVPGRQPNVAERAGVAEDFILTHASKKGGSKKESPSSPSGATTSSGASGSTKEPSGMTGSHNMYKITGLDEEKLRQHANKQVEIVGRVTMAASGTTGTGAPGTSGTSTSGTTASPATRDSNKGDMPELRATSIKQLASSCQSTE